jgi:SMC interacting uncharacterized protein involved in chromosome segregation
MSKEKLVQLNKYADSLKNRISDKAIPEKQKNRMTQYRNFLQNELHMTNSKIESLKMAGPAPEQKR